MPDKGKKIVDIESSGNNTITKFIQGDRSDVGKLVTNRSGFRETIL